MDMDILLERIKNVSAVMCDAADIVRYSVLFQNSISYLDLKLHKDSNVFLNTEEKFLKLFLSQRRLLYTLNLDTPLKRKQGFQSELRTYMDTPNCSIPQLEMLKFFNVIFHEKTLSELIQHALAMPGLELKILKLILKFPFLQKSMLRDNGLVNIFLDCLYSKVTDSVLLKDFVKKFDILDWMVSNEKPQMLSYLLYNARIYGRDFEEEGNPLHLSVFFWIEGGFFLNIPPILKYVDTPRYSLEAIERYIEEISSLRLGLSKEMLKKAVVRMNPEMACLMLPTLLIFLLSKSYQIEAGSEALCLLWKSSHQASLSFQQVQAAFGNGLFGEKLSSFYEFYNDCIGKNDFNSGPRPLKNLCRVGIRKIIRQKKMWIPDGIAQMGLPRPFQLFLNLET